MPMQVQIMLASSAAAGGVGVLRYAWARKQRSQALNAIGWGLFLLAAVLAGTGAGAWGVSVAAVWAMLAALVLLGQAALSAPLGKPAKLRPGPEAQAAGQVWDLGRRSLTFALVVPLCLAVAIGLGLAMWRVMLLAGAGEADAIVAGLFMVPLGWMLLACGVLMAASRKRQWGLLLGSAIPGIAVAIAGMSR